MAARMVAISVVIPRETYETLKKQADTEKTVVAELVGKLIETTWGSSQVNKIDQKETIDLVRQALLQTDTIANAIAESVSSYLDAKFLDKVKTL